MEDAGMPWLAHTPSEKGKSGETEEGTEGEISVVTRVGGDDVGITAGVAVNSAVIVEWIDSRHDGGTLRNGEDGKLLFSAGVETALQMEYTN